MAFGIGSILGAVAGPLIGAVVGGPAGAAIGAGVTAATRSLSQPQLAPTAVAVQAPRIGGSQVGPTATPAMAGALVPGARAMIQSLLAVAGASLGKRVTASSVLSLTRELGLVAAAAALGLTAVEVAQIIATKPRRRRRGITAAQIATTRRTIRKVTSIQRALAEVCPPPRRRAPAKKFTATRVQA